MSPSSSLRTATCPASASVPPSPWRKLSLRSESRPNRFPYERGKNPNRHLSKKRKWCSKAQMMLDCCPKYIPSFPRISRIPHPFAIKYMIAKKCERAKDCENGHMFSAYSAFSVSFRDKYMIAKKSESAKGLRKWTYGFRVFRVFRVLSQLKRK